jgi:hypothetical protein
MVFPEKKKMAEEFGIGQQTVSDIKKQNCRSIMNT